MPKFSEAFEQLTQFYAGPDDSSMAKKIAGTKSQNRAERTGGGEIDLTMSDNGEDEVEDESADETVESALNEREQDPVGLAAGLPCELLLPWRTSDPGPADSAAEEAVLALVDFPKQVVVALSVAVTYMTGELSTRVLARRQEADSAGFKLQDAFRHRSSFTRFVNRAHMLLSSNTLINLYDLSPCVS